MKTRPVEFPCGYCGATAGQPCLNRGDGVVMTGFHAVRFHEARWLKPLDRIDLIVRDSDDSDFGDLLELNERLLPLLRAWLAAHASWQSAVAQAEFADRPVPIDVIGHFSDELRRVDRALMEALLA